MSLPRRVLEELREATTAWTPPAAHTTAIKFLHHIDDENLLTDQMSIRAGYYGNILFEWELYQLYFHLDTNLSCHVHIIERNNAIVLNVDAATELVTNELRFYTTRYDDDEYRKTAR